MPTLKWIAVTTVLIYLVFIIALYFMQRQLLYFPRSAHKYEAEHNYELRHDGITLRGWEVNPGRTEAIIYYGGNAERIDYYIDSFKLLFPAHSIYLVNYRGYGKSEGTPSEDRLYADALAVYDSIRQQHDNISLIGKSLGSGIATYVAANRTVEKLVLVTPYDSIVNVAKEHYPMFPVSLLLTDKYESWKHAKNIIAPTLILSAQLDQIIPAERTRNLAAHFDTALLTLKQVANSDHNSISGEPLYYEMLADYFSRK